MGISTAIDPSAVARVIGIKTEYKDLRPGNILFLPQRIAIVGQGTTAATYALTKRQITSAIEAGEVYGYGSPIHLAARQLFPVNGDGVGSIPVTVYPLDDAQTGVASSGDITPSGTPTAAGGYYVLVNNIRSAAFVISVGMSVEQMIDAMVAAINAVPEMPVIATDNTTVLVLASKWKGVSANDIKVAVTGPTTYGVSFAITQPTGGLVNPDVDTALALIGPVWETLVINCLDIADTTTLGKYYTAGAGRWGAQVRKPFVVFTGNTATAVADATTVSDARKTDNVNAQIVLPGSAELPLVVAARAVSRIAVRANSNPAFDFGGLDLAGLTPGADGSQWLYASRDAAVKKGSSTVEIRDGVAVLGDVVTFYHPANDPLPAYRYVIDIIKLQNIIFNIDLIFTAPEWNGAPLIPDVQPTINRAAKKPRMARAAIGAVADSLGLNAIISDPAITKNGTVAEIDDQNPKRLNVVVPVALAGNTNIISIDLQFGFYFGTSAIVA